MKSVLNKKEMIRVFSTLNSSDSVDMIGEENSAFTHEDAECNIISYVQFPIHEQNQSIQVSADDTDIFVLLVYFSWKWKAGVNITMKNCCVQVIDVNATAAKLGYKCSQLLVVYAITGYDIVSYCLEKERFQR